ncbi:MAG: hypothetical protein NTX42_06385 [Methanothrix sp.]|nr:hypothetical protein [Methanothrix sp.]
MITEFENKAHELCRQETNVIGSDLNLLWANLSKEYRSDLVDYYPQDSAQWTYISHIDYLSAESSMTPPEKLRKFFGIEIDRKLFEDAMDVVQMRVLQFQELEGRYWQVPPDFRGNCNLIFVSVELRRK